MNRKMLSVATLALFASISLTACYPEPDPNRMTLSELHEFNENMEAHEEALLHDPGYYAPSPGSYSRDAPYEPTTPEEPVVPLIDAFPVASTVPLPELSRDASYGEGVKVGLATMEHMANVQAFYEVRDTAGDALEVALNVIAVHIPNGDGTFSTAPSVTGSVLTENFQQELQGRRLTAIPTVNESGSFGWADGVELNPSGAVESVWSKPTVLKGQAVNTYGEPILSARIDGERTISFKTAKGDAVTLDTVYSLEVTYVTGAHHPKGGEWKISNLESGIKKTTVVPVASGE